MLLLSRSLRRKILATVLAASGFVLLYDATVIDSRRTAMVQSATSANGLVATAGSHLDFTATAYCKGNLTAAGVPPQSGIAAADPLLLPEGSVVQVDNVPDRYRGIYTVMDTGPKVLGRHVDLYMWSCIEATTFGRRPITLTVLRLGWNPRNTSPGVVKAQF